MSTPESPEKTDHDRAPDDVRRIQPLDESLLGDPASPAGKRSYYFFRSLLYGFLYFALVMALLTVLALIGIGLWVKHCRKSITPHQAQRARTVQLTGWLAFNDMEKQTPEVRNRLVRKYEYRLNLLKKADINSPIVIRAIPYIQQAALEYLQKRDEKILNEETEKRKSSISRPDYRIENTPDSGRYILSTEVRPTDALLEEIKARQEKKRSEDPLTAYQESQIESNIRTLTKELFLRQMSIYDDRPDEEKTACILEFAATLNHFSELYDKARTELGLPPQGTVEQIRDLNHIVAGWIDTTTPDYLARLYWFKDVMVAVMAAGRAGDPAAAAQQLIAHAEPPAKRLDLLRGFLKGLPAKGGNGAGGEAATVGKEAAADDAAGDEEDGTEFF